MSFDSKPRDKRPERKHARSFGDRDEGSFSRSRTNRPSTGRPTGGRPSFAGKTYGDRKPSARSFDDREDRHSIPARTYADRPTGGRQFSTGRPSTRKSLKLYSESRNIRYEKTSSEYDFTEDLTPKAESEIRKGRQSSGRSRFGGGEREYKPTRSYGDKKPAGRTYGEKKTFGDKKTDGKSFSTEKPKKFIRKKGRARPKPKR